MENISPSPKKVSKVEACRKTCLNKYGIMKVRIQQHNSFSKNFSKATLKEGTKKVFMPGCSLSGYNKTIVDGMNAYLKTHLGDVDLFLQCCGQPSRDVGNTKAFYKQLQKIQDMVDNNHIQQIIVACENCYEVYQKNLKRVEVITIWEVIADKGIPKELLNHYEGSPTYALHDPCRVRYETQIHESVRSILDQLGLVFIEFEQNRKKTVCCGSIDMNHVLNPKRYRQMATKRAQSTESEDIIGYCQSCVNALSITGKNTIHLADFLFNSEIIAGRSNSQTRPGTIKSWKNRWDLAHSKDKIIWNKEV